MAVLVTGAGCGAPMTAAPLPPAGPTLWVGGDVSAVPRLEQAGATFRDGDRTADPLLALRARGANLFRLRLFVAPNGDEVQVNDLPYTIALAQRVRATGARLLLDVHYSDTWADPGRQLTPAAWADLPLPALEDTVEAYTRGVLQAMRAANVLPDFVQVGNEVDAGFLWPLGRLGAGSDTAAFTHFSRLLRAGIRGVRGATSVPDSVRIIIHHSQGADPERTAWFFDRLGGLDYDIIGLSYYPWWHGDIRGLRATLTQAVTRHEKDVMVVETAYP
jgi:arabinogalactan endo-1,4-beta-galactosidase